MLYTIIDKFRRRFARFLIVIGLVYMGAAIATAGQKFPTQAPTQQFITIPAANSQRPSQAQNGHAVLGQTTDTGPPNAITNQAFIQQCAYQTVPYKTIYKTASWLESGRTFATGGIDGEEKICNNQNGPPTITIIVTPLDKTVTTGTNVQPTYTPDNILNQADKGSSANGKDIGAL